MQRDDLRYVHSKSDDTELTIGGSVSGGGGEISRVNNMEWGEYFYHHYLSLPDYHYSSFFVNFESELVVVVVEIHCLSVYLFA